MNTYFGCSKYELLNFIEKVKNIRKFHFYFIRTAGFQVGEYEKGGYYCECYLGDRCFTIPLETDVMTYKKLKENSNAAQMVFLNLANEDNKNLTSYLLFSKNGLSLDDAFDEFIIKLFIKHFSIKSEKDMADVLHDIEMAHRLGLPKEILN